MKSLKIRTSSQISSSTPSLSKRNSPTSSTRTSRSRAGSSIGEDPEGGSSCWSHPANKSSSGASWSELRVTDISPLGPSEDEAETSTDCRVVQEQRTLLVARLHRHSG